MVQRFEDTLFQPIIAPRVAVYDDPRMGPEPVSRAVGVLQQLRPIRREHRRARRLASAAREFFRIPNRSTAKARALVSCSNQQTITIVGDSEVGPGQATCLGTAGVASGRGSGERLRGRRRRNAPCHARQCPQGPIPIMVHPGNGEGLQHCGHTARYASSSIRNSDTVSVPPVDSAGWTELEWYPMVINANAGAADPRPAPVVAMMVSAGPKRLDGRRLQRVHERPVRCRHRETAAESEWCRSELRPHERQ